MPGAFPDKAATVLLAAGRSSRMGSRNKLLMELEDAVPVVRRSAQRAIAAAPSPLYVVTGHEAEKVRTALSGLSCRFVHNPDYADGLSGSIRAGFGQAVADGASGVLVLLADMPFLPEAAVASVLDAAADDPVIPVQAVYAGKPAHPVWLPAALGPLVETLGGDTGVRSLLMANAMKMRDVEVSEPAVIDIDTPDDFEAARHRAANMPD